MKNRDYAWLLPVAALALAAGILLGRAAGNVWPLWLMLPCAAGACALLKGRTRLVAAQALVLAVSCVLGWYAYHPALPEEGDYTVSGVVAEEIRLREDGQVRTLLRGVTLNGEPLRAGAYWSFYLRGEETLPEDLAPGVRVELTARVYHPGGPDNPGGYDFREYLLQKGATIGVYGNGELTCSPSWHPLGLAAALRNKLAQGLAAAMGDTAGSYAATMLLGSQHLVPTEDREAFSRLGIAHILSVSGFHVSVLAGLVMMLFRRLHLSRKVRFLWLAVLLALYSWLTGLHAPVIRASLLFLLFEFGALKHRQRSRIHLLCASWVVQLLVSPAQLTSLSFQLTYGAMLGLMLVTPWLEAQWSPRRGSKVWSWCCAALGAQAGILLPELYWFHELPLLGILLNSLVMGAATVLMTLCWAVLFLLPVFPVAQLLGQLTALLLDGMLMVVRFLGGWEGITLWTCRATLLTALAWAVWMLAMSWWYPGKRRPMAIALSLVVLAASVCPWPNTGTRYVQLSVGEADAAVLQDGPVTMAIDTGEDGQALAEYLHQRRLSLDALVLTHLHADHAGGVQALLDSRIPVAVCYLPYGAEQTLIDAGMQEALDALVASGTEIVHWGRGDELSLPSGSITVLWPESGKVRPAQDANESSLVLRAELCGTSLLLTGDLGGAYEMYAAAPADVLKVAHHGSEGSTSPAFLQAVGPELLLLSCGDEARSLSMEARRGGIPMADTRAGGAVTLEFDENGFTVETLR